jgi:hypothetical protein
MNTIKNDLNNALPFKLENYPTVTYWYKDDWQDEQVRRQAYDKENKIQRQPGCSSDPNPENVSLWFIQNTDGTMVDGKMATTLRAAAKDIWAEMSKDYGPMGLPWTKIPAKRRVEFCIKLKSKFPVLHLCADHYKANTVATSNYTRWYKTCYPETETAPKMDTGKRRWSVMLVQDHKVQHCGLRSQPTRNWQHEEGKINMDMDKEHKVAAEDDEEIKDDNNKKATSDLDGDGKTEDDEDEGTGFSLSVVANSLGVGNVSTSTTSLVCDSSGSTVRVYTFASARVTGNTFIKILSSFPTREATHTFSNNGVQRPASEMAVLHQSNVKDSESMIIALASGATNNDENASLVPGMGSLVLDMKEDKDMTHITSANTAR